MRRALDRLLRVLSVWLLLPAGLAHASDFGCLAEWVDLGLVLGALPAAGVGLLLAWRARPGLAVRAIAVAWTAAVGLVVATTCTYGKDADLLAVGATSAAAVLPLGLVLWRARSGAEPG